MKEDQVLWESVKNGNSEAITLLYKMYYQILFSLAYRISKDKEISKDCIHDLFVKLWENHKNLPTVDHVRAYLITSIKNSILKTLKKNQKTIVSDNIHNRISDVIFSVDHILIEEQEHKERSQSVKAALATLTEHQKELIYLYFYEGMSIQEIQEITTLQYQSVKNLIYRALTILRKALKKK